MKKILLTLGLIGICGSYIWASPGDTTKVQAHNKMNMTWNGNYDAVAVFPSKSAKTYNKILLNYTMGCATNGCSDWDYTTQIMLMHKTGEIDSTVSDLDTVSTNPLVIDTTWSVFDVTEAFEIARVITPYGGNLPSDWKHNFVFDVTDYYPLMADSVTIRARYSGWSSGFSVSTEFIFIEGTPSRKVIDVSNVYQGYFNYITTTAFENNSLYEKTMPIDGNAKMAMLRVVPSGHGFVNSLNCAEFCEKDYYVEVNNARIATQAMWRDDCGLNPIWPQAGTWLYDRANWCPGSRAPAYDHEITPATFTGASSIAVDVDIEPYSYTVPSGQTPAGYNFTTQLFQFENIAFNNEVELVDILAPSNIDDYGRMNPVCGKVMFKIANNGAGPLTSCVIKYGIEGGSVHTYNWTGNLNFRESEIVEIAVSDRADWQVYFGTGSTLHYWAIVEQPNGQQDEFAFNNSKRVSFKPTPVLPGAMKLLLKTNGAPSETFWSLKDAAGTLIASGDNLTANKSYTEIFSLSEGCYELLIGDRDKDGLSFFGNNDGNGSITLRNDGGTFFAKTLNANFGTELRYNFTVGMGIGIAEEDFDNRLKVYPNPANDLVVLEYYGEGEEELNLRIIDVRGTVVYREVFTINGEVQKSLEVGDLSRGVYNVELITENGKSVQRLILN